MSPLAMDVLPWVGGACALFVVALAVAVLASRQGQQDALDREIEARLMLGEDPDKLDRELAERRNAASAVDQPHRDNPTS